MSFSIFDEYADRYDAWYNRNRVIAENELRLIRKFVHSRPILEVGVGTGFFASKLGVDIGIDPALSMLVKAHSRSVDVIQAFGEHLPIRSKCISVVLLIATLCFLENPSAVVKEVVRVLRPSGSVIVCIVPKDSSWGMYYSELGKRGHVFYSRARLYTVDEVDRLFKVFGMRRSKALGILRFKPWNHPVLEEPIEWFKGLDLGFVCLKYIKGQ